MNRADLARRLRDIEFERSLHLALQSQYVEMARRQSDAVARLEDEAIAIKAELAALDGVRAERILSRVYDEAEDPALPPPVVLGQGSYRREYTPRIGSHIDTEA